MIDFQYGFYKIKSKYHKEYTDKPEKNKWFKYNIQPSLLVDEATVTTIEMIGGKKIEVVKQIPISDINKMIAMGLIEKIDINDYVKL